MKKKYLVRLSASECAQLTGLIRQGKAAAYRVIDNQVIRNSFTVCHCNGPSSIEI